MSLILCVEPIEADPTTAIRTAGRSMSPILSVQTIQTLKINPIATPPSTSPILFVQAVETKAKATIGGQAALSVGLILSVLSVEALEAKATMVGQAARRLGLILETKASIVLLAARMGLSVAALETKAKATIGRQAAWSVGVCLILSVSAFKTKAKATMVGRAAGSVGLIIETKATIASPQAARMSVVLIMSVEALKTKAKAALGRQAAPTVGLILILIVETKPTVAS